MTSQSSSVLLAGVAWLLSAAVVVPRLATGQGSNGGADCETSCGGVDIPFPFGMGPDHCMLTPGFRVTCQDVGNGVRKAPFLAIGGLEILNISLEQAEAEVLNPISSFCYNDRSGEMVPSEQCWDLSTTPFSLSSTANKFTVVGCRALAYIGDVTGKGLVAHAQYQTGCVAMCFYGTMALNPCSGMGCCQTAIPQGLQYYHVWFDESLSISGIDNGEGIFGACSFAVLMKDTYDFSLLTSDMGWSSSNFSNISMGFNTSLGGKAPMVLDWSIGYDNCTRAVIRNPAGYACRSSNSFCSDAASGRGYICKCNRGFDGNPYLPDGCQDIDECLQKENYNCFGDCTNTNGSFDCTCANPEGCKDSISRTAKITTEHATRIKVKNGDRGFQAKPPKVAEAAPDDSAKLKRAFNGVLAAAPPGKDYEAAQAVAMEQQLRIFAAVAQAEKTGGKDKVASLKGSYEKAADLVIAAPPADKLKVMKKEFTAVADAA